MADRTCSPPDIGADLLAVRTASREWETPRWQQQGGFALTDFCFGPERDGRTTFRLLSGDPGWPGLADIDEAGRRSVVRYLSSYGPAIEANPLYWLTEGLSVPRRRLLGWLAELGEEVTEVTVDNTSAYVRTADLDELSEAQHSDREPFETVRLVPGFDPWVMGPGTADVRIIAPERRALASRGANLVVWGGFVCGTWRVEGLGVTVAWFDEAGPAPAEEVKREVRRLADTRARELKLTLTAACGHPQTPSSSDLTCYHHSRPRTGR